MLTEEEREARYAHIKKSIEALSKILLAGIKEWNIIPPCNICGVNPILIKEKGLKYYQCPICGRYKAPPLGLLKGNSTEKVEARFLWSSLAPAFWRNLCKSES